MWNFSTISLNLLSLGGTSPKKTHKSYAYLCLLIPLYTARIRFFLHIGFALGIRSCWAYYVPKVSENFNDMQIFKKKTTMPLHGFFSQLWTPKIFFQKSGTVTFVPLWCPNFMKKNRKTNWLPLRYIEKDHRPTDHWQTDRGDYIGLLSINKGQK